MTEPLWRPSPAAIADSNMTRFRAQLRADGLADLPDSAALWDWSVNEIEHFWQSLWKFCGVVGEQGATVLKDKHLMPGARFFPEARLNFTENVLRSTQTRDVDWLVSDALVFWGETQVKRSITWAELGNEVSRLAQHLRKLGVRPGDRVAGFVPNAPEAVIGALASAAIGAIWSSCSPDFGVQGVVDRFGQIEPKVLITADGYWYGDKQHDSLARVAEFSAQLPSIQQILVFSYLNEQPDLAKLPKAVRWRDALQNYEVREIPYERVPFDHPLYIMYSSGTTGAPKCIVHGHGGTLLQHLKEHQFHADVKPKDRIFYFSTCGWMMWNWLVSGLASGATLLLYDGSPFAGDNHVLFDYAQKEGCTLFGTSAKYIDACVKQNLDPKHTHDLSTVRLVCSTGSPLAPEGFDWVYEHFKDDVCLSSISGGTDIVSCFMLGNPTGPVWRGEIQMRGLGMKVEVWDDNGQPVPVGEKGELVCTAPFPSMPVGFWNDPDGARYKAAYFETYPNIWRHGDYIELTEHGGIVVHGRSDAVLNPGGVRIGTAEIYRQVELLPEVEESIVIGQDWEGDVRVVLFVKLRSGLTLDDALRDKIKKQIRQNTTPRHVPAKIIQVSDIPRTKSGKIVELAVRDVVHGRAVKNKEALANPEALALYCHLPDLR
jgi:acetoacetyl-CoA synthetase